MLEEGPQHLPPLPAVAPSSVWGPPNAEQEMGVQVVHLGGDPKVQG